jgi:hypothetical protein
MKQKMKLIIAGLIILVLASCGGSNGSGNSSSGNIIPGESVALILTWVINGDEATQGTATFTLYDDNGTYYVDFDGEACRVKRISPIDVGNAILCYSFTTHWGGTYYLEDITDPSKRFYNL